MTTGSFKIIFNCIRLLISLAVYLYICTVYEAKIVHRQLT